MKLRLRPRPRTAAIPLLLVAVTACRGRTPEQTRAPEKEPAMTIRITSPAFAADGRIPRLHTGEGRDVSPPLAWTNIPPGTREFALICDDPDAPSPQPWVHWVLYRLPAALQGLAEGDDGRGVAGVNDFKRTGYGGPMPPRGHGTHHYRFTLYALAAPLDLAPGATKQQLLQAMQGHVLGQGVLVGTYAR